MFMFRWGIYLGIVRQVIPAQQNILLLLCQTHHKIIQGKCMNRSSITSWPSIPKVLCASLMVTGILVMAPLYNPITLSYFLARLLLLNEQKNNKVTVGLCL